MVKISRKDFVKILELKKDIQIMKTEIIYFSATNTTREIVKAISKGLKGEVHFTDITLPQSRKNYIKVESDLTIIATPVYGERIPRFLLEFLKQLKGNGNPLVAVSVYGNVGFGISLEQFRDFAVNNNFRLIAAGVFIGQHTYATKLNPVAYGRPNKNDLKQAYIFGENIQKKMDMKNVTPIVIPKTILPKFITEFPDIGTRFLIRQPKVKQPFCNSCGACVRKCPIGAIEIKTLEINEQKCIRCYACVNTCPKKARVSEFRLQVFANVFRHLGRKKKANQTFW